MDPEVKSVLIAIEKQAALLERIAKASERTNEILFTTLTQPQRDGLASAGLARLTASHAKPKT